MPIGEEEGIPQPASSSSSSAASSSWLNSAADLVSMKRNKNSQMPIGEDEGIPQPASSSSASSSSWLNSAADLALMKRNKNRQTPIGEEEGILQPASSSSSWLNSAADLASITGSRLSSLGALFGRATSSKGEVENLSEEDEEEGDGEETEPEIKREGYMKKKLKGAWHTMRYGKWKERSPERYLEQSPIWLLGMLYHSETLDDSSSVEAGFRDFLRDYYSRIWLTYRVDFPPLPHSTVTSDCGWGCTLRTMQMMLAQSLTLLHLGREWRWRPCDGNIGSHALSHGQIIRLFDDDGKSPIGIHRLMSIAGRTRSNPVGEWYAPSIAASLIRDAVAEAKDDNLLHSLTITVCIDGIVVLQELERLSNNWSRSVLLVVCIRLGTDKVNQCYYPHLRNLLALKNTVGIVGGCPNHSLYFVGSYHKCLIYLDPHVAHKYHSLDEERRTIDGHLKCRWKSFHCLSANRIPTAEIDPSCAVGLLLRSRAEMERTFRELNLSQVIDIDCGSDGKKRTRDPIFTVTMNSLATFEGSVDSQDAQKTRDPIFTVTMNSLATFEGSVDSQDAQKVAQAREHGFELV